MAEQFFSPKERKAITALALQWGFKSLREYLRALVKADAERHGEPSPIEVDEIRRFIREYEK